jgi:hypothetical protein
MAISMHVVSLCYPPRFPKSTKSNNQVWRYNTAGMQRAFQGLWNSNVRIWYVSIPTRKASHLAHQRAMGHLRPNKQEDEIVILSSQLSPRLENTPKALRQQRDKIDIFFLLIIHVEKMSEFFLHDHDPHKNATTPCNHVFFATDVYQTQESPNHSEMFNICNYNRNNIFIFRLYQQFSSTMAIREGGGTPSPTFKVQSYSTNSNRSWSWMIPLPAINSP